MFFWFIGHALALEVQGHRGARAARPENTIPAFLYALDVGVDTLELDTLVTKDGVVVVTHDPVVNLEICAGGPARPVRQLTLAELRRYDCGGKRHPRFDKQTPVAGTRVPTLAEVFVAVAQHKRGARVQFNVETKSDEAHPEYAPAPREFVEKVLAVAGKAGVLDRLTLQSFDFRTLREARRLERDLKLSLLLEKRPAKPIPELMRQYDARVLSPAFGWLTAEDVLAVHKEGGRVIPWTANTAADWRRLVDIGVDGIITDDPAALWKFLRR